MGLRTNSATVSTDAPHSRWSFMERQEFMKIVDEAQNTIK